MLLWSRKQIHVDWVLWKHQFALFSSWEPWTFPIYVGNCPSADNKRRIRVAAWCDFLHVRRKYQLVATLVSVNRCCLSFGIESEDRFFQSGLLLPLCLLRDKILDGLFSWLLRLKLWFSLIKWHSAKRSIWHRSYFSHGFWNTLRGGIYGILCSSAAGEILNCWLVFFGSCDQQASRCVLCT